MAEPGEHQQANRAIVTIGVMLATFMQALDTTVANVCLPHIQGSVSASLEQIEWVLTSYLVAGAIATPTIGWLSGRFGSKRLFVISVAGFTVTSMLCGVAASLSQIVLFRFLQGIFGAALIPLPQAMLLSLYPPQRHNQILAFWVMISLLGPSSGPILGGWLTDHYGWRWVFYINVPVGIAVALGAMVWMQEWPRAAARRFDWTGFALCSVAIAAFQLMLDRGETLDWFDSTEIRIEAAAAALGFYLLVVQCLTSPEPFIKPRLFVDRNYLTGVSVMLCGIVLIYTMLALLTPFTQTLIGTSVVDSGILQSPRAVGGIVAGVFVPRLLNRFSPRSLVLTGLVISAIELEQMSRFTGDVAFSTLLLNNFILGIAVAIITLPTAALAFSTLRREDRGDASAVYALIRNLSASAGIAVLTTQLTRGQRINHAEITRYVTPTNRLLETPAILRFWNPTDPHRAAALDKVIDHQALTIALASDFRLLMILSIVMIPVVAILCRSPKAAPDAEAMAAVE